MTPCGSAVADGLMFDAVVRPNAPFLKILFQCSLEIGFCRWTSKLLHGSVCIHFFTSRWTEPNEINKHLLIYCCCCCCFELIFIYIYFILCMLLSSVTWWWFVEVMQNNEFEQCILSLDFDCFVFGFISSPMKYEMVFFIRAIY